MHRTTPAFQQKYKVLDCTIIMSGKTRLNLSYRILIFASSVVLFFQASNITIRSMSKTEQKLLFQEELLREERKQQTDGKWIHLRKQTKKLIFSEKCWVQLKNFTIFSLSKKMDCHVHRYICKHSFTAKLSYKHIFKRIKW